MKYTDKNARAPADASASDADPGKGTFTQTSLLSPERRRSDRLRMRHAVVLSWYEGETERVEPAFTTTISRHGCGLRSRVFFQPGTRLRLELKEKAIEGRVVHSLKDYSTGLATIGMAFDRDGSQFWQAALGLTSL